MTEPVSRWATFRGRREGPTEGPPREALLGSLAVHGSVIVLAALASAATPIDTPPTSIRVRMVAAAPADAPVRVDPSPPEVAEEEHRPPPPDPTPEPRPRTETPKVQAEVPVPRPPEREPARTAEVGDEPINVQLEGRNFEFPGYMANIIRQIQRYWRPPPGGRAYRAEISFVIHRDGSVTDIQWVRRSGSASFDLMCSGAVEAAARERAFGPLPAGYPLDRLAVSFYFDPTTR